MIDEAGRDATADDDKGFVAKAGEGKVLDKLSDAALNPVEAQRLLQMNIDPSVAKLIWARQGLFSSLGTSTALLGNSTQ